MPSARTNAREHPSSSHSPWGGSLKFVVQPVMAKHPDQPDKWTVSGVERSYASKEHADKVRDFLKKSPPAHIKNALAQGKRVDDLLPSHLQKLPRWDDVHGIGVQKEGRMAYSSAKVQGKRYEAAPVFSDFAISEALERAKESLECGCFEKMQEAVESLADALGQSGVPPQFGRAAERRR